MGRRWQLGQISVAQEHYATEFAHHVLSQVSLAMTCQVCRKGNLVVTCVGNEMHGLGSRMVADFLEMDGWDVSYLGANTPHADVISMLKERKAKALLVSVTMGYNIKRVRVLIRHIRAESAWKASRWWWAVTRSTTSRGCGAPSAPTASPRTRTRRSGWSTLC